MPQPTDLLQGTLDLLILRTLALEPMHGWGIAQRIQLSSQNVFQIGKVLYIPRFTGWNTRAGYKLTGSSRITTEKRNTTP